MATRIRQRWQKRVTIADVVTPILEVHAAFGIRQSASTCSLVAPLPLADQIAIDATVTVEAALNGVWLAKPLFTGVVRQIEPALSEQGAWAAVSCEGPNYRLNYAIGKDVTFAGGAKAAPQSLLTSPVHIGPNTYSWYADTTPVGLQHDVTFTPSVDSDFLWFAGKHHGSNDWPTSYGDKKLKQPSKIQVIQTGTGKVLGYANLPKSNEDFDDELDYTDIDNWEDFEVFVAAKIRTANGTITVRFLAGEKPGSSERDNFEVRAVTYQTAARTSLRKIVRGLKAKMGLSVDQYLVNEITDLDGDIIYFGGNGLADAGQVRIEDREQPSAVIGRALELFGFYDFDCPDGITRTRPVRGVPSGGPVVTFTEQLNVLDIPRWSRNPRDVYNAAKVDGWSGNDEEGKRVRHLYRTANDDVLPSPYIPDPPGTNLLTLSNNWLVSDELVEQVGKIAEVNNADPRVIEWTTWPHVLNPADVVAIEAPTVGFEGPVFLTDFRIDIDASGFWMPCTGWVGTEVPFSETPDPDPDEDDEQPGDPRDASEWGPYRPLAGVQ